MSQVDRVAQNQRFDRTITMGLLVTIILQTAGAFMWAGAAEARLSFVESQIALHPGVSERLARLEGQTTQMAQSLARIERNLAK